MFRRLTMSYTTSYPAAQMSMFIGMDERRGRSGKVSACNFVGLMSKRFPVPFCRALEEVCLPPLYPIGPMFIFFADRCNRLFPEYL